MNYRLVVKYLGHFTFAMALLMLPSLVWAAVHREWDVVVAFAESMAAAAGLGLALTLAGWRASDRMFQREGLALVGLGWLLTAAIGALPFIFTGTLGASPGLPDGAGGGAPATGVTIAGLACSS